MTFKAALLTMSLTLIASPAFAAQWDIDSSHSHVGFAVKHMMISNVNGSFGKVTGKVNYDGKNLSKATLDANIDVSTVNTNEPKRDEHLKGKDFFEVEKYPAMTFKAKSIKGSAKSNFTILGDLTMHGVTKPVTLKAAPLSAVIKDPFGKERMAASATTVVNRKDFGMTFNKNMDNGGVMLGDDVKVTLDLELVKAG